MSNNILIIEKAEWTVDGTVPDTNQVYIKGQGTDGINIPPTKATVAGSIVSITSVAASTAFPANRTQYYAPFTFQWQVSFNGAAGIYYNAGTSQNIIYVSFSDTGPNTVTLYRTVVHLACSVPGAFSEARVVTNTWSLLGGGGPKNFEAWDEATQGWNRKLYYYKAGTKFDENATNTAALLQSSNSSGQCTAWSALLKDALKVNGVVTDFIYVRSLHNWGIVVRDWTFNTPSTPGEWKFLYAGETYDMVPVPPGSLYGEMLNDQITLSGQWSIPPSQKLFDLHRFIGYDNPLGNTIYLDPSYGVVYTGEADFQTYLAGFWDFDGSENGRYRLKVTKPTATLNVGFSVE